MELTKHQIRKMVRLTPGLDPKDFPGAFYMREAPYRVTFNGVLSPGPLAVTVRENEDGGREIARVECAGVTNLLPDEYIVSVDWGRLTVQKYVD